MKLLLTGIFYVFVCGVSIVPFRAMYWFSNFAAFVMRDLVQYRTKVVYKNLKLAFPEKSEAERNIILKKYYRNLTDNLLESFKTFTMRKSSIIKRHRLVNPELLTDLLQKHDGIIGATGHYANWEWGSLSGSLQCNADFVAFYKPLRNKYMDNILRKSRCKCGTELASIKETSKTFLKHKNQKCVFLMAADQCPSKGYQLNNALWIPFLGVETPFLNGIEKHARANNYPIVYIHIQRVKRGYYEVELETLIENPSEYSDGEITKIYTQKLEQVILNKPEDWLWSHDRWKRSKSEVENA